MGKDEINSSEDGAGKTPFGIFKAADPKLQEFHDALVARAQDCIGWYIANRVNKRIAALSIRWVAAITLGIAAALVGLQATSLNTIGIPAGALGCWQTIKIDPSVLPIICAGIGSGLLVADSIFGYSTGWVRYMQTELSVRRALDDFEMDWSIAVMAGSQASSANPGADAAEAQKALDKAQADYVAAKTAAEAAAAKAAADGAAQADKDAADAAQQTLADSQEALSKAQAALTATQAHSSVTGVLQQLLKAFSVKIDTIVADETQQWVIEFQRSMALLQKKANDVQPAATSGAISLSITRGANVAPIVTVEVDGQQAAAGPNDTFILQSVPAGIRQVTVNGTKNGAKVRNSVAVTVAANAVASTAVPLT